MIKLKLGTKYKIIKTSRLDDMWNVKLGDIGTLCSLDTGYPNIVMLIGPKTWKDERLSFTLDQLLEISELDME